MMPWRWPGTSVSSFRPCAMFGMIGDSVLFLLTIALIVIGPRGLDEVWVAVTLALEQNVMPLGWRCL